MGVDYPLQLLKHNFKPNELAATSMSYTKLNSDQDVDWNDNVDSHADFSNSFQTFEKSI